MIYVNMRTHHQEIPMNIYDQYAIACAHLQGMISVKKAIEICRQQNPDLLESEVKLHSTVLEKARVLLHEGMIVHRAILVSGDYETFRKNAEQKPSYIPPKEELLRYVDEKYFEKPEAYLRLEDYLRKKRPSNATEIAERIRTDLFYGDGFDRIIQNTEALGLRIGSERGLKEFVDLIVDLSNNLRIWDNNGYTPNELRKLLKGKPIENDADALQDELAAFFRDHGRVRFLTPAKTRPFRALLKRQKETSFDEMTMEAVDALGERLSDAGLFSLSNAYNLLDVCPFAYRTITAWLMNSEKADQEDLLRLIIIAYERARPNEVKSPAEDFYEHNDNLHYILALDNLGSLLKSKGRLHEAIEVYHKALQVDLGDRKKIGEAILVCYFGTGRFPEFDEALHRLPEDSLFRIFLELILNIMLNQPADKAYEQAKLKSPLLLRALECDDGVPESATEAERYFYYDFYPIISNLSKLSTALAKLAEKNALQIPTA
jgi:tetratricopeptide (TPR) repeat protein